MMYFFPESLVRYLIAEAKTARDQEMLKHFQEIPDDYDQRLVIAITELIRDISLEEMERYMDGSYLEDEVGDGK